MGPIWGRQDPRGPHMLAPWTLLSGNIDLSSVTSCDIHLSAISQERLRYLCFLTLKISNVRLQPCLSEANELNKMIHFDTLMHPVKFNVYRHELISLYCSFKCDLTFTGKGLFHAHKGSMMAADALDPCFTMYRSAEVVWLIGPCLPWGRIPTTVKRLV